MAVQRRDLPSHGSRPLPFACASSMPERARTFSVPARSARCMSSTRPPLPSTPPPVGSSPPRELDTVLYGFKGSNRV